MLTVTPPEIQTYSGCAVNVFDPDPDSLHIDDIAHALSNQCRFSGHTSRHYSVAEHSVNCCLFLSTVTRFYANKGTRESKGVTTRQKLTCLMHDAAEAYLVDLPTPIKKANGGKLGASWDEIEAPLMQALSRKFQFDWPFPKYVHDVDLVLLLAEKRELLAPSVWAGGIDSDADAVELSKQTPISFFTKSSPEMSKSRFLDLYEMLRSC